MMSKVSSTVIVIMLALGLATVPAVANGQYGEEQSQSPSPSSQMSTGSGMSQSLSSGTQRISELMDMKVKDVQGEDLGSIKDVVLSDGQIRYVILSKDAAAGATSEMIPVPFQTISRATVSGDSLTVHNLTKDKLDKAPTISEQEWDQLKSPSFESTVFGYYGEQQPSSSQMEQPSSMPSSEEMGTSPSESESGMGSGGTSGSGTSMGGTGTGGTTGSGSSGGMGQ
ncbi:MAG TPA: PRC-barrel domain-containing protein [Thermodesulfobacteriota bacterium]|nr:PRC-barrel domain-containing protein [Thermodesulfobacteriota bacterium]